MNVVIRSGVQTDRVALRALHAASWRASHGPFVPADALDAPLDANMDARWATWPSGRRIVVAERGGRVIGLPRWRAELTHSPTICMSIRSVAATASSRS